MLKNTKTILIGNFHLGISMEQNKDSNTRVSKPSNLILICYLYTRIINRGRFNKKKSIKSKYNSWTKVWDSGHSKPLCNLHIAHAHCKNVGFFFPSWKILGKKYQINPLFCCHYLTNLLFNKIGIQSNSDFQRGTQFVKNLYELALFEISYKYAINFTRFFFYSFDPICWITVKLGFKERLNKEQLSNSEPFHLKNSKQIGFSKQLCYDKKVPYYIPSFIVPRLW